MSFLFDTHLLIWALRDPNRLPHGAEDHLNNSAVGRYFSAAAVLETAIKNALRRPDFDVHPVLLQTTLIDLGFQEIPITGGHAVILRDLPAIHGDPFDRIIVAQAIGEDLTLVTADRILARYPANVVLL